MSAAKSASSLAFVVAKTASCMNLRFLMQLHRFCNSDYSNLVFMLEAIAKPNHGGLPERTILVVAVLQLPQFEVKKAIVENTLVGFAKGGIYENVIMSLLVMRGFAPGYFMPRSNLSEVDFLIEKDGVVVPIEVKAGNNASASFVSPDNFHSCPLQCLF